MSWITDRTFWTDTAERTVSSAAQGLIAGAGLEALTIGPALQVDLVSLATTGGLGALLMAVLTLAKCVAAAAARSDNQPAIGTPHRPPHADAD